jgi:hypothetical protein
MSIYQKLIALESISVTKVDIRAISTPDIDKDHNLSVDTDKLWSGGAKLTQVNITLRT